MEKRKEKSEFWLWELLILALMFSLIVFTIAIFTQKNDMEITKENCIQLFNSLN